VALPVGSLDTHLTLTEIDIAPFERHHLAAPQARFPTRQVEVSREHVARIGLVVPIAIARAAAAT